ncbi:RNH202 (YDR279W) [Zygosaccharomyces parabailii]|uniref:Ribonuclease H2 subunit B n=1 Tax=Zygosaccharomyces bailii (strain CLIB 213 / ATCC 58445 / CBS 680 / BCRC 21525 / NBRC 1098 / NCYC 1416 / NRRL Y-2227) TaxID=1333698 RepID=A0A8J2WYW3_ZYGB2|nr:RNH202 (YDR279W) [Zygosaccharomyces parabailii]CDF89170.1 ZYBA0S03-10836g1_1 [Zygosaccharomyces bailii CLIB 213]CDH16262.1 related to RNH202-Ribonuclease H2 subunit,required for RNase H2 activity [Zygosaccharomyces bailii ISA1307]
MTIGSDSDRWILVLPPELYDCNEKVEVFTLPHPSNIKAKKRPRLVEFENNGIYELRSHQFSRGCKYYEDQDRLSERYHYTKDGQSVKSTFITNELNPEDGYVIEEGNFRYVTKYDITFNLIGFFYRHCVMDEEKDYLKGDTKDINSQCDNRSLGWRDYQDLLIDTHDSEWCHISSHILQKGLENIAEPIEEAGDVYYKITPEKIVHCLVRKVKQILEHFPSNLPPLVSLPPDIVEYAKVSIAVNFLISLIPKPAYCSLVKYSGETLNISEAIEKYQEYKKHLKDVGKEKELLVQTAMSVGLPTNRGPEKPKKIIKKVTVKKKVAMGKGAIDGFFKKSK